MQALEFFGHAIYLVVGVILGATFMYFGPLLVEWIDERKRDNGGKEE